MDLNIELKRTIGLGNLILYGVGTMVGAGIFVLVGKVAGHSGMSAPFSFIIAAIIATLSGLSYAEMASRYPTSAGASLYIHKAYGKKFFSIIMGFVVILSGVVSAGVLSNGFADYLQSIRSVPSWSIILVLIAILGGIAIKGIKLSSFFVGFTTLLIIAGIIMMAIVGREGFADFGTKIAQTLPSFSLSSWKGVLLGSFLAFYVFIGFEDMVNNAEEIKNPQKNIPKAIISVIGITTILYLTVIITSIFNMPISELSSSSAPVAELYQKLTGYSPVVITIMILIAASSSILVQIIMASRLLYGMGKQKWIPSFLSKINKKTQTPIIATLIVLLVITILTLFFDIVSLAEITSFLILFLFIFINLGLIFIKRKKSFNINIHSYFKVPIFVPYLGVVVNFLFIIYKIISLFII